MSFIGDILTRCGSDKDQPGHHNYGPVYDSLFPTQADRDIVLYVMEIGIAEGQSLWGWAEIFSYATIVGVDIEPYRSPIHPRMEIHQGDQRDEFALLRATSGRKFDLIVEDAQHTLDNSLRTLFFLWPYVEKGGLYVIEELQDVNSHLASIDLFRGARAIRTIGPGGNDEHLVVIRKET